MLIDPRIEQAIQDRADSSHGGRRQVVARLAAELGVSVTTAYRKLDALELKPPRKRRKDANTGALAEHEAMLIWSAVRESTRQTGTGAMPVMDAVQMLRANGLIEAARVDETTGEWMPLSESTIRRSMRGFGLSLDVMTAAPAASRLSSPHPNHCWQIDASVSRQFYLADDGSQEMAKAVFYRGKPGNFSRINERRIWRYCVTDHASGCIEVFYVQGAESAANAIAALMHAMTRRSGGTMHGVPRIVMSDPGSGFTAAPVKNFMTALGIRHLPHATGNARATGQVENSHYIVERHFEAGLKFAAKFTTIEQINTRAQEWARAYNATRIHSRTGMTRRDGWLRIAQDQLVLAPAIEVLTQLPNSTPKPCKVKDCMIRFGGDAYDVRAMPGGVVNGQRLTAVRNALDDGCIRIVFKDEDGQEMHFLAPKLSYKPFGFLSSAAEIGAEFKSMPESPADARNKALERLAMGAQNDRDAAAARKAKRLAFGGMVDPMKPLRETNAGTPDALPRAGTPSNVMAPTVAERRIAPEPIRPEYPPLNHVDAARAVKPLVERAGGTWSAELYQRTAQRWPDGLPLDQVEAWAAELAQATRLRVVGGAA